MATYGSRVRRLRVAPRTLRRSPWQPRSDGPTPETVSEVSWSPRWPAVRLSAPSGRKGNRRMLVVHALWSPGRGPLIWGLDANRPVKSTSQAVRAARAHPFAADVEALAEIHSGKPTAATLLLPSLRTAPLDSPELVRTTLRPSPQRPPALLPWVVPALLVNAAELGEAS